MASKSLVEIAAKRVLDGQVSLIDVQARAGVGFARKVADRISRLALLSEQPAELQAALNEFYLALEHSSRTDALLPRDYVELCLKEHKLLHDNSDHFFRYNGAYWEPEAKANLLAVLAQYEEPSLRTSRRVDEALKHLARDERVHVGEVKWNSGADSVAAFKNGTIDIAKGTFRAHRPEDFIDNVLPWDYDANAKCPAWLKTLDFLFAQDAEGTAKVAALQEFFGYVLMNHARYKKALVLYGSPNTGKTGVASVLRNMVGLESVCQIDVNKMGNSRDLAPIYRKRLNLLGELDSRAVLDDGGFKLLVSTSEAIQLNPKYEHAFSYLPICKHVFATNNLPTVNDTTEASFDRFLIIKFNRIIQPHERNSNIEAELNAEIPGILLWALEGARRLMLADGKFTQPQESKDVLLEYRYSQNPVDEYIQERYVRIPGCESVWFDEFCEDFNSWFDSDKDDRRRKSSTIGIALRGLNFATKRIRDPENKGENKRRIIVGLGRIEVGHDEFEYWDPNIPEDI